MVIYFYFSNQFVTGFKVARAQKIGLKSTNLKNDLGKSLSKEMWWNMVDTKKNFEYIFKKMKNACNMRVILFVSVDKKRNA